MQEKNNRPRPITLQPKMRTTPFQFAPRARKKHYNAKQRAQRNRHLIKEPLRQLPTTVD